MIRLVCICGKHLRARDEAALRRAVCPSCGCPVSTSRQQIDTAAPAQKPLTMKDGPLQETGLLLVPLWDEGQAGPKAVPRYQVVAAGDAAPAQAKLPGIGTSIPNLKKRKRPIPRSAKLNPRLEETLLFPFYSWRPIVFFALLLGCFFFVARAILTLPGPVSLPLRLIPVHVIPLAVVAFCSGYWLLVFATTVRGENSVVLRQGLGSRELLIQMLRCLVCFLAGPALIIGIAWYYWLSCGDLVLVDKLILAELLVAALMYWTFASLAVAADNSLYSVTAAGMVGLLRRLGWRTSAVAVVATFLGILFIVGPGAWSLATLTDGGWSWVVFPASCLGMQVFMALFSRWLGVRCYLAGRERTRNPVA